ncbi:1,4-dihydroxy-2-naphthoate octaprenyltransferase [Paucihalobacter sp.]|uniref:1,4-dihydroxy-2-naphthoate octaprenyltransferase n=1 Tax=Paucihalobacter sp. TaxID=2850405 RepID=UPI002FDF7D38
MNRNKKWVSAMRLRTLPLSISGIFVGSCLAYYNGYFNVFIFIFATTTTLAFQILSNLANDYGDGVKGTDNNERIGPERAIQSGAISANAMLDAIKTTVMITIFSSLALVYAAFEFSYFLYAFIFICLAAFAIYAALTYTIGESPYGYKGLGDVYVFAFFGILSVVGTYFLNTKQLDHVVILPAISVGLLSVGVLNLNNMRDIESDEKSEKMTMAVKFGKDKAKQYHLFLIISAMVASVLFSILYYSSPYNFIFYFTFIPLIFHIKSVVKAKQPSEYDPQLKVLALTTFFFAILLGVGQVIY